MGKINIKNQTNPTDTPTSGSSFLYVGNVSKNWTIKRDDGSVKEYATTEYVDNAVAVEDLWDRFGTILTPKNDGDDITTSGDIIGANITGNGNLNIDSGTFYVNSTTDRVGIGTASPSALFTINSINDLFTVDTNGNVRLKRDAIFSIGENDDFIFHHNTSFSSITNNVGDLIMDSNAPSATFQLIIGGNSDKEKFSFQGDGGAELLTLNGLGNLAVDTDVLYVDATNDFVGMGTISPSAMLHIRNSGVTGTQIRLQPNDFNDRAIVSFYENNSNLMYSMGAREDSGHLYFSPSASDPTIDPTPTLALTDDKLVGIGIELPTEKLHVAGNGLFSGNVTASQFYGSLLQTNGVLNITGAGGMSIQTSGLNDLGINSDSFRLVTLTGPVTMISSDDLGNLYLNGATSVQLPSNTTGVTPSAGDSSTKVATTAFVTSSISEEDFWDRESGAIYPKTTTDKVRIGGTTTALGSLNIGVPALTTTGAFDQDAPITVVGNLTQNAADETIMQFGRNGVDGVIATGQVRFDMGRWNVNYHGARSTDATMKLRLSQRDVGDLYTVAQWRSDGAYLVSNDLFVDTDTLYVDSTNDRVGINQASPTVALDIVGDIRQTDTNVDYQSKIVTRTIGTTVGDTVQLGAWDGSGGTSGYIEITLNLFNTTTAHYIMATSYFNAEQGTTGWHRVIPISYAGNSGNTEEIALDVWIQANSPRYQFRARRVSGSISSIQVHFKNFVYGSAYTDQSGTDVGQSEPTQIFGGSVLTQRVGNVGIGKSNPSVALDVVGSGFFTGSIHQSAYGSEDGLILDIPFSEIGGNGTTQYDRSQYGISATNNNVTVDSSGGQYGYGGSFSGTSWLNLGNPDSLNQAFTELSFEFWYNKNGNTWATREGFIAKQPGGNATGYEIFTVDEGLYCYLGHSTAQNLGVSFPIADSVWHHVVVTYSDVDNEIKTYLDGVLSNTVSSWNYSLTTNTTDVLIGTRTSDNNQAFTGFLDKVKMYDRVLQEEEVRTHYLRNGGSSIVKSDSFKVIDTNGDVNLEVGSNGYTTTNGGNIRSRIFEAMPSEEGGVASVWFSQYQSSVAVDMRFTDDAGSGNFEINSGCPMSWSATAYTLSLNGGLGTTLQSNGIDRLLVTSGGAITINSLTESSGVYTDSSKNLTSTPPVSGTIGFWTKTGTEIFPSTANDILVMNGEVRTGLTVTGTARHYTNSTANFIQSFGPNYSGDHPLRLTGPFGAIGDTASILFNKVGIKKSDPLFPLDVDGMGRITGDVIFGPPSAAFAGHKLTMQDISSREATAIYMASPNSSNGFTIGIQDDTIGSGAGILGTMDAKDLTFITNTTIRQTIKSTGEIEFLYDVNIPNGGLNLSHYGDKFGCVMNLVFDQVGLTKQYDQSPKGSHATLYTGASVTSTGGKQTAGLVLDGLTGYAVTGYGLPTGANDRTIEILCKSDTIAGAGTLFRYGTGGGGSTADFYIRRVLNDLQVGCTNDATGYNGIFTSTNWHLIQVTYNGIHLNVWFDRVKVVDEYAITLNTAFTQATIGAESGGASDNWDGNIDYVRVYDRVLTEAEIMSPWMRYHGEGARILADSFTVVDSNGYERFGYTSVGIEMRDQAGNDRIIIDGTNTINGSPDGLTYFQVADNSINVTANNVDFEVNCGTEKTLKLGTSVWKDWNYPVSTLSFNFGSNPDIINLNTTNIEVAVFDGATTLEEVSGVVEIDHDYKEGTNIYPHIHWYPTTTGTGNVKWQLEYVVVENNTVVGSSTTISVTASAGGTAWDATNSEFPPVSGSGLEVGDQLHFRLFRDPVDAADTYGADAATATFGFHYESDTMGSRQKTSK